THVSFRMPAEWSPHDAVWTAWPHDPDQWLEGLAAPQRALMKMIAAIVDLDRGQPRGERVELLVRDGGDEAAARQLLGPAAAGVGTVLTTRQCLLGGARNPGLDQRALDARLCWALGASQVVWLDRGLANDHTDGHIDTLARFVTPGVVACMEPAPGDPNRDAL